MYNRIMKQGRINAVIADAANEFTNSDREAVYYACTKAEEFISSNIKFDYPIDIIFSKRQGLAYVWKGFRANGHTYNSRIITIVIEDNILESKDVLYEVVCHELAHSYRWEKNSEYASCLFDNIIFEGLGVHFEELAMKGKPKNAYWKAFEIESVASEEEIRSIYNELKPLFDGFDYDYDEVFSTGNDKLPKDAAYKLGFYLVKKYMTDKSATVFEADLAKYSDFYYLKDISI